MENRAERALCKIAAVKPCPNCDGTGTIERGNGRVYYCSVCEGRKHIPALGNREAQLLAAETLATIQRHREATDANDCRARTLFPREARSVGGRELRALPDTLTVEEVAELLRSQAVTRLTSGRKLGDPEPLPESGLIYCVGILADPQEEEAGA